MRVDVLDKVGGKPISLDASTVVVRDDAGTPLAVVSVYGPDGSYRVSHCGDSDFMATLKEFGITGSVEVNHVKLPGPPSGAELLSRPG